MKLLTKLFGKKDDNKKHENTGYSGMWICPNCDISISTDTVEELETVAAWYCCPGCGYNHKEKTYKEKVEEA